MLVELLNSGVLSYFRLCQSGGCKIGVSKGALYYSVTLGVVKQLSSVAKHVKDQ